LPQLAPAPDLGPAPPPPAPQVTHQVDFLPQCDKVAIMDDGNCVYFGPWNEGAAQLLSKYLPASHLLAAAGQAEQPRDTKKKPAKKAEEKKDKVRRVMGWW
jgi:ABC-type multidrug transport system ATPase subunit